MVTINSMAGKTLLGKLDRSAFGMLELPRLPGEVLRPTDPAARIVGQAVTVLNRKLDTASKTSRLGEIEAHNLAAPGDVLVIQGVAGISSMGGISASIGKRQGEAGAVVDGAVRIAGIEVRPGDLVVADECGVCFVPHGRAEEVLAVARRLAQSEEERLAKLASGMPLAQFAAIPRKD